MSMLGTSPETLPPGFPAPFIKKSTAVKYLGRIPLHLHHPPSMAYSQKDYPDKYVATSLNYVIDLQRVGKLIYCTDKRMQNSIKIKYTVYLDELRRPQTALISIYE